MPKAAMRERPDVLKAECGAQQVLELIANKWTALVIYSLGQGPMRHSALRRRIGGISQKMLTQTLRNLFASRSKPSAGGLSGTSPNSRPPAPETAARWHHGLCSRGLSIRKGSAHSDVVLRKKPTSLS